MHNCAGGAVLYIIMFQCIAWTASDGITAFTNYSQLSPLWEGESPSAGQETPFIIHVTLNFSTIFYVHVTVHRNKFLYNKTNYMH